MLSRTVVMYMEIGCFVLCLAGWMLVCSTVPTEYWTFSEVGSAVLTTSNFYSNLWKDCLSDTTGVSDCKEYPSLLALPAFLHATRALVIISIILGFFGAVLVLVGMKCTKIGGSEMANAKVALAAGINYLVSGFSGLIAYSWWGNKVRVEFVDPNFRAQKFEIGAALFIGWGGSFLLIVGGGVLSFLNGKEVIRYSATKEPHRLGSYASAGTRRTYIIPPSSRKLSRPSLDPGDRENRRSQTIYPIRKTRPPSSNEFV